KAEGRRRADHELAPASRPCTPAAPRRRARCSARTRWPGGPRRRARRRRRPGPRPARRAVRAPPRASLVAPAKAARAQLRKRTRSEPGGAAAHPSRLRGSDRAAWCPSIVLVLVLVLVFVFVFVDRVELVEQHPQHPGAEFELSGR